MTRAAMSRTGVATHRSTRDDRWSLAALMRTTAILVAVLVLFSGAGAWGWNVGRFPVPPLATMVVVFACAAVAILLDIARLGSGAMWGWAIANAVVAMTGFLWSSGSEEALQQVRTRVLSSMQLVAYVVVLADPRVRRAARMAIVLSTFGAIGLNLWELTHPMTFSISLGRSAGFYVNPNIAGAALIAGMLLGLPAIPSKLRELYMLVVGVGVFTTLSRGAMLCWAIVTVSLLLSRAIRGKRLIVLTAAGLSLALSVAGALLASGQLGYIGGGAERFVRQRLSIGNSEGLNLDASASSRSQLSMHAFEMFSDRPLAGHGTGATVVWNEPESTHNIYLRQLAEYGLFGAWLAPLLLVLGWRAVLTADDCVGDSGAAPIRRAVGFAFMLFVGLWGLFSHNVLDDPFVLIGLALIAAVPSHGIPRNSDHASRMVALPVSSPSISTQ